MHVLIVWTPPSIKGKTLCLMFGVFYDDRLLIYEFAICCGLYGLCLQTCSVWFNFLHLFQIVWPSTVLKSLLCDDALRAFMPYVNSRLRALCTFLPYVPYVPSCLMCLDFTGLNYAPCASNLLFALLTHWRINVHLK